MALFLVVHVALIGQKMFHSRVFIRQNGFLLVVVELGSAFFFLMGYILLISDYYAWFSIFFNGVGWNFSMLWVDLIVYAMFDPITMTYH